MIGVRVCVGCLATDVRMYSMSASGLLQSYQLLVGVTDLQSLPQMVCYLCGAMLRKLDTFRVHCRQAYTLLHELYRVRNEVTPELVDEIHPSDKNKLKHPYSKTQILIINETNADDVWSGRKEIKSDQIQNQRVHKFVEDSTCVKPELEFATGLPLAPTDADAEQSLVSRVHSAQEGSDDGHVDAPVKVEGNERDNEQCGFIEENFTERAVDVDTVKLMSEHGARRHMRLCKCRRCNRISKQKDARQRNCKLHKAERKGRRAEITSRDNSEFGELRHTMTIIPLTQEQQKAAFVKTRAADARYKCTICLKGHNDAKAFSNHERKHEPISGKYQCDICKYRYRSRHLIQKHLSRFHVKQYSCKICSEVFNHRIAATKHHLLHKGKIYTCQHCGFESRILSTHLSHVRLKHASQHVCGLCAESFVSRVGLNMHARRTHQVKDGSAVQASEASGPFCDLCAVQFTSLQAWTKHMLKSPRHTLDKFSIPNGCRDCGETYPTEDQLKVHRRAEHPARKHFARAAKPKPHHLTGPKPCVQCGQMMSSRHEYWQHFRRAHPGDIYPLQWPLSHICEQCGKGFRSNALLQIHQSVHAGERKYKCPSCPKSFYKPINLRNHLVSHSEARPHECDVCRKGFKFKTALMRHMRTHTGDKPYVCGICTKTFSDSSGRNAHTRTVHARDSPATLRPNRDDREDTHG